MNLFALLGLDGWIARWRAHIIEGAIAAEDRLELARLEWTDQKRRIGHLVVLAIALAGLTVVTLTLVSMAVLVQFWDTPHRILAAWVVAGVWFVLWAVVLGVLISTVRKAGNAFALTRRELAHDWRDIKERL
ncbi:MAG: phage holin family protein [Comamonadaceae bacterium]|nr:MAG: phage holin family protein [Comamonadaceae bacterium]